MKNAITAFIEFYFKGQKFNPSIKLDLDTAMREQGCLPQALHNTLAKHNGIGAYSYELEMLEAEEVQYRDPEGPLATAAFNDGRFDSAGFEQAWRASQEQEQLQAIARQHLGIDDLQQRPDISNALQAAFLLGQKNTRPEE